MQVTERPEVTLTVKEGGRVYTNVAAHLKGAAGSFRPYDDKPAFTLNFSKFAKGQRFHGYTKISLNNSVQDPTLIHEMLSRELFVAAGVPAPRAHHATLVVNGRDLGVYVVVEGWGKPFLKQHFDDVSGNLYDGGFVQDIDGTLSVVSGDDEESHPGLKRLIGAVRGANRTNGWERLSAALDMERFATLLAMDTLICNWDGYGMNRNNWRVFHDRSTDRMVFMPHGLDQVFGYGRRMGVDSSIEPGARAHVARVFLATPQGRKRYLERLAELRTNVLDPDRVTARIEAIAETIRPTLKAYSTSVGHRHDLLVRDLMDRVRRRAENVSEQLARPNGMPTFDPDGVARIQRWRGVQSQDMVGRVEFEGPGAEGRAAMRLRGEGTRGSWRSRIRLDTGTYRLEGRARLRQPGEAVAGLRISGEVAGMEGLRSEEWVKLIYDFVVEDPVVEVDLVLDVVGSDVVVEMDAGTFRLVRFQ